MHAAAPLLVFSAVLATAAVPPTPHVPLGTTGEKVQRLTLLPGPTLTSPARGIAAPPTTDIQPFNASLHTPPTSPQLQFQASVPASSGRLILKPTDPASGTEIAVPPKPNPAPLLPTAPRFEDKLPPTKLGAGKRETTKAN